MRTIHVGVLNPNSGKTALVTFGRERRLPFWAPRVRDALWLYGWRGAVRTKISFCLDGCWECQSFRAETS